MTMIVKLTAGRNSKSGEVQHGLDYDKARLLGCKSFVPTELTGCVDNETGTHGFFLHRKEISRKDAIAWLKENKASNLMVQMFQEFPKCLDYTGKPMGVYS